MPRTSVDINGATTTYAYNANGTLAAITEPGNRITRTTYNAAGQPVSISYPDGSVARYTYTASGRLEAIGNALHQYGNTHYDLASNTSRQTAPRNVRTAGASGPVGNASGEFSKTTVHDSLGRPYVHPGTKGQRRDIRYDPNGNVTVVASADGTISYEYDAQNRLVKATMLDGGVTYARYDHAGRLQSVTDPRGVTTSYSYNGFGDLTSISFPRRQFWQQWLSVITGQAWWRQRQPTGPLYDDAKSGQQLARRLGQWWLELVRDERRNEPLSRICSILAGASKRHSTRQRSARAHSHSSGCVSATPWRRRFGIRAWHNSAGR